MTTTVVAVILFAGLLHATWNTMAHRLSATQSSQLMMLLCYSLIALVLISLTHIPNPKAWPYLAASAGVQDISLLALLQAYKKTEFSTTYPISRGLGPLIVAGISLCVPSQHVSSKEFLGIAVLICGIVLITIANGLNKKRFFSGYGYVLIIGTCIATYTLLDGVGVHYAGKAGAVGYGAWSFLLQGLPAVFILLCFPRTRSAIIPSRNMSTVITSLLTAAISMLAYGLVMWAQSVSPGQITTIAGLRECGILLATLIGVLFLGEKFSITKAMGSVLCLTGIILIA